LATDTPLVPPVRRARLAAGLLVVAVGAGVFAALASQLGADGAVRQADQSVADAMRAGLPQALRQVFAALTHLADPATLTLLGLAVAGMLVARRQWLLATGWAGALVGNGLLNPMLKGLIGRDRPLAPAGEALVAGFSFPSGHSAGAVVAYGMLAYLGWRLLAPRWHLPALAGAGLIAGLVGLSRLVLGVHFASDVVAGFASGAAWLALCVTGVELWRRKSAAGPGPPAQRPGRGLR